MDVLDRKKHRLESLKKNIERHKRKEAIFRHQISILTRREEVKKLICAGRIFKEAGILDSYKHDEVLDLLKSLGEGR